MTEEVLDSRTAAAAFVVHSLLSGEVRDRRSLEAAKRAAASRYSLGRYLSSSEILSFLPDEARSEFVEILRVHPRRSGSGIVVVTVFSAPFLCPHGTCVFCPGGPKEGTPQSYLADGPGMKAAIRFKFDPYLQSKRSLEEYQEHGHPLSKVEAVIEGGTFISVPLDYQENFVKGVYDGLNGFASESLREAQRSNESAMSRCVGLTIESKPDWCEPAHIDMMLSYGVTRLEIGVQSLANDVLKLSNRGHTVEDAIRAFAVAKDAGLKVACHMMPGLPGATPGQDAEDLRRLFEDESFRPDMMKVYPTLVVGGTALARMHKRGDYEPYDLETVVELLSEMKRFIPGWHRIMRIQREIPALDITAGIRLGNLRELVLNRVREKGRACRCIRCREVALNDPHELERDDELSLVTARYQASGGTEVFVSSEYRRSEKIAGFVRMRVPSDHAHRAEMRSSCVVRELKVYGRVVPVGERNGTAWQHKGLGSALMNEVERLAKEQFDARRILVTSAVGTRNYYRALGYEQLGPYVAKRLD